MKTLKYIKVSMPACLKQCVFLEMFKGTDPASFKVSAKTAVDFNRGRTGPQFFSVYLLQLSLTALGGKLSSELFN